MTTTHIIAWTTVAVVVLFIVGFALEPVIRTLTAP